MHAPSLRGTTGTDGALPCRCIDVPSMTHMHQLSTSYRRGRRCGYLNKHVRVLVIDIQQIQYYLLKKKVVYSLSIAFCCVYVCLSLTLFLFLSIPSLFFSVILWRRCMVFLIWHADINSSTAAASSSLHPLSTSLCHPQPPPQPHISSSLPLSLKASL